MSNGDVNTPRSEAYGEISSRTDWVEMRDGTLLHTQVYLPGDACEPLPVVMMRNPYNGAAGPPIWEGMCMDLARHGYAVLNQDVRGTARSEGMFSPFHQETCDGYDAVEWAARQGWSNGKIGLWGISYLGVCVMQAATLRPPHLVAGAALYTASDYHDHWAYENGLFNDLFASEWIAGFVRDAQLRIEQGVGPQESKPLDVLTGVGAMPAFAAEWSAHPLFDQYWASVDLESRYAEIDVPIYVEGGWFDGFASGTLRNFMGLHRYGKGSASEQSRLVMAPRCHQPWASEAMTFPNAPEAMPDMNPHWWDRHLKLRFGQEVQAPVRLYVMAPPTMGREDQGGWVDAAAYPPPGARTLRFAISGDGSAAGTLVPRGHSKGLADEIVHDPERPVPTLGGPLISQDPALPAGIADQSKLKGRSDIVAYSSQPLEEDLVIVGPVRVHFCARSDSADARFSVKLTVMRENGSILNYLDRMVSASLPMGARQFHGPARAGELIEFDFEIGHTAVIIQKGMRLRLEIAPSNYPRFLAAGLRATHAILHDEKHPAWLEVCEVASVDFSSTEIRRSDR